MLSCAINGPLPPFGPMPPSLDNASKPMNAKREAGEMCNGLLAQDTGMSDHEWTSSSPPDFSATHTPSVI